MQTARHPVLQAVVVLWAAVMFSAAPAGAREFRAADTQAEDYPTVQALNYMGKLIAERTNGRHQIKVFHRRQLGEEKETIEQTRAGAIDLNRTNVAPIGEFVPLANVLAMPFLFRSIDHLHSVLDSQIGQEILDSFAPHGFVGLTYYDFGARSIYNSVRPIKSVADMKNLKIRVQQSDLMIKMINALGAQPIAMPYGQVLTGLADQADRRRREQLAVLRDHRPLQVRRLLHADRAHHVARSAGHVAQGLGVLKRGGSEDLQAGRAGIQHLHA